MAVIKFHARTPQQLEPEVWSCRCGSFTFWLYSDGTARCSECRAESTTMDGYWHIPERGTESATVIILPLRGDSSEGKSEVVDI